MPSDWIALRAHLDRMLGRQATQRSFLRIAADNEPLRWFADPAAMLTCLHDADGRPDRKNAVLAALVRAAQGENDDTDAVLTLLFAALWPGLDAIWRRQVHRFRSDPALLASEIAARATSQICRMDLDRVSRIAATIIRNVERDIGRMLIREDAWTRDLVAFDGELAIEYPAFAPDDSHAGLRELAAGLDRIFGRDAALVADVALAGFSQAEAATRAGISHEAARKRYRRALSRAAGYFYPDRCPNPASEPAFPLQAPDTCSRARKGRQR